jgi:hypothetical protein
MTETEKVKNFANALDSLVDRYGVEFEMTYAAIVGVLTTKAHLLIEDSLDGDEDGDDNYVPL